MKFMLTKEQYELLYNLRNGATIDEDALFETLMGLKNMGYVCYTSYKRYDSLRQRACDFKITENGKIACEEYEKSLRQESREVESLKIAKDSKLISWVAIGVSVVSLIAAIFIGIYT